MISGRSIKIYPDKMTGYPRNPRGWVGPMAQDTHYNEIYEDFRQ